MKTKFIFIRHAQSVAKEQNIVQGRGENIPLSGVGTIQARELPSNLSGLLLDNLFSSTSVRAVETAKYLCGAFPNTPYEKIEQLHERSKGDAEGMSKEAFLEKYREIEDAWEREEDPRVPGGESFADVEKRVMPIIMDHLVKYVGKTSSYVIHGNVIRVILGAMLGIPPEKRNRIAQDYCGISIAEYDDRKKRWKVVVVNAKNISAL